MNHRVVAIAVHPDDETLGCGGTLLKHKEAGDRIYWLIVTAATTAGGFDARTIRRQEKQISRVEGLYAFDETIRFGIPTMRVDACPMEDLVRLIGGAFQRLQPTIVYLPFKNDPHSDHRRVFDAAYSCTKAFRFPSLQRVLMMETLSETELAPALPVSQFVPTSFVDISAHFKMKQEILKVYADQLGTHPFPRSAEAVRALALLRGAACGCRHAEAFMLLKEIWRQDGAL